MWYECATPLSSMMLSRTTQPEAAESTTAPSGLDALVWLTASRMTWMPATLTLLASHSVIAVVKFAKALETPSNTHAPPCPSNEAPSTPEMLKKGT